MAIYHCSVKAISRSAGRSATAAAAYRSAGRIEDERQGTIHDYTRKGGVVVTGIALPDGAPEWARDRSALWNAAEAAEKRKNATVAREVEVALPQELDAGRMREIVEEYSEWLTNRYGVAVDWAIHQPHRRGDERNYHAHILMTTRILGPEGLGAKCRTLDAKETGPAEVLAMRERWADTVNRALEQAGLDVRVDHRRLEEQGIEREPQIHAGPSVTAMERKAAAPDPEPLGVIDAITRTGGTTTVGQRLATIVELNTLREERERQRILAQERKAAARQEFAQSHRKPMPDTLAIGQTVAALVARQAQQQLAEIQRRWDARRAQRQDRAIAELLQGTDPRRDESFAERIQSLQTAAAPLTDTDRKAVGRAAITAWERQRAKDPLLAAARDAGGWKALRDGVAEQHRKASSGLLAWMPDRKKAAAEAVQNLARIDQAMVERRAAFQAAIQRREQEQQVAAEAWAQLAPHVEAARTRFEADHQAWQERQRRELERKRQAAIEAEREARRQRLWELTETLQHDRGARMDIVQACTAAGYVLVEKNGKRVLNYPHADLLEDRKAVQAARKDWDARRQQRLAHEQEEEAQAEKAIQKPRNGQEVVPMLSDARPRKKTLWRQWREKTLAECYGEGIATRAVREDWYIRMRPDLGGLNIVATKPSGSRIEIVDGGDILRTEGYGSRDEIALMLDLAQAKGWTMLNIEGSEEFRLAAATAAFERNLGIADKALEQRVIATIEKELSMPQSPPTQAVGNRREQVQPKKKTDHDPTDDWW